MPVSKRLVTTIYKPFRPFGRGTTQSFGDLLTMVMNYLLTGMILQVEGTFGTYFPSRVPSFFFTILPVGTPSTHRCLEHTHPVNAAFTNRLKKKRDSRDSEFHSWRCKGGLPRYWGGASDIGGVARNFLGTIHS